MNFVEQWREVYEQWRRKAAIVATVLLSCVIFYHVVFGSNGWMEYQKKKADYKELQERLQRLSHENETLQKDVKALKGDRGAIEREAREQLHYTRPGEVVYVVPGQQPNAGPPPATTTARRR